MVQTPAARCDCCGLLASSQARKDCSRCGYPLSLPEEECFLETELHNLQRVANYGGAALSVTQLIRRYSMRLHYLRQLQVVQAQGVQQPVSIEQQIAVVPASPSISPQGKSTVVIPAQPPVLPAGQTTIPPIQQSSGAPRRVFSLRSFFAEQVISIIGLLGAFLILMGALSSIVTADNRWLSFLIVFGVHAFFGIAGIIAYRFASARLIARIYTGVYALLVPLVGFTAYSLIQGNYIHLSVPTLAVIASIYAAIVYVMLAVYQRFSLFGYLGAMALVVANLALVKDLNLNYWWWPSMLMLLALPALLSISTTGARQFFTGSLAVLREPVRVLMFILVGVCALGIVVISLYSFALDSFGTPIREVRFSLLSMTGLLLLWRCLFLALSKRTQGLLSVAHLFLVCVLAICYAFDFSHIGYALALSGIAVLYHGLNRLAAPLLQPFGKLGLYLDRLALLLVSIVPLIGSLLLPEQLFFRAYHIPLEIDSPLYVQANWDMVVELVTVAIGFILSISVLLYRANLRATASGQQNSWPSLLLLSGFLLTWAYSVVVLVLHVEPAWCFLGLTLALVTIAVAVGQRLGAMWANPLDMLALSEALLALSLSMNQSQESISAMLLGFAALSYAVLLYQRRRTWLFLPFTFALLALPFLFIHLQVALLVGILLPLTSVAIRRLMRGKLPAVSSTAPARPQRAIVWEWPLLAAGLLYGVVVSLLDLFSPVSTVHNWLGVPFPVALEMVTLGLAWYGSAAVGRVKGWLFPVIGFAVGALLLPSNPFWVLVGVTPGAALLALGISRVAGRSWASPLYIVALLGVGMTGYTGYYQHFWLATTWTLLAFALLAYIIGVIEDWDVPLWLVAGFATWSILLTLQTTIFYAIGIGVGAGFVGLLMGHIIKRPALHAANQATRIPGQTLTIFTWSWPWYLTTLVAAVITGLWTLLSVHQPAGGFVGYGLLTFTVLALGIMLVERVPELLVLPVSLAVWALWRWQPLLDLAPLMIFYSLLCVLIFASQFVWNLLPPVTQLLPARRLHQILSLVGQGLVVLIIIGNGGLSADAGLLAFVGAGALLTLAVLVFCYGRLQRAVGTQSWWNYGAGFLVSLVIAWTLSALRQTNLNVLTLAPATYLIVIAPLLLRSTALPRHHRAGQGVAVLGTALLLLPTLWLSFSNGDSNLLYTLVLVGESVALMLLGVGIGVRIFVLSGAGLIVVSALHALFLPTLGVPTPLALTLLGTTLLAIATALSLARRRLQAAWTQWE